MNSKVGILIAQLGTPDAPTTPAVRRYLAEFLSDRRVVDLNRAAWWLILNGIVLRTRPSKSAELYRKVWTAEGSPLLCTTRAQASGLARAFDNRNVRVEVAMRYGNPSTKSAVDALCDWGAERILLFPMYPQYSAATTGSTYDAVFDAFKTRRYIPALRVVPPYFDHPLYISALASSIREKLSAMSAPPDRVVISFHGIPQRYADLGDPYPQQCEATVRALAAEMKWSEDDYMLTFQSRFGREPWLQPYTDETLMKLGSQGVRRVLAICPGFIADCLETIDEIGNLGKEQFEAGGGESLELVSCVNDRRDWISAMSRIAEDELRGWL